MLQATMVDEYFWFVEYVRCGMKNLSNVTYSSEKRVSMIKDTFEKNDKRPQCKSYWDYACIIQVVLNVK